MSLKNKITEYLKQEFPRVVHKGELGKKAVLEWGYENENLGRRCRELENSNIIKKCFNEKGHVEYQYIQRDNQVKPNYYGKPKQIKLI